MNRRALGIGATVAGVAAAALGIWWLYTTHSGFLLGLHTDEPKKIDFALTGENDFHHPVLMLQMMRLAGALLGADTMEPMTSVGRTLSAAYTLVGVAWAWLLFRRLLDPAWAVAAALALAVTPLFAVHAHYVKEDTIFLATVVPALWASLRFVEHPEGRGRWAVLGLTMGLMLAAQYKGGLLVALLWLLPTAGAAPRSRAYYRRLRDATAMAAVLFVLVCYPLLLAAPTFSGGVTGQVAHALSGHYVKIYAIPELFSYHVRHSLIPGLTPAIVALALGGVVWGIASWRRRDSAWRIALLYLAAFYLTAELSPSKPPPDFMRYMIPAAPIVVALAFRLLQEASRVGARWAPGAAALLCVLPLVASVPLVTSMETDTRIEARARVRELEASGARILGESDAGLEGPRVGHADVPSPDELRAEGYTHFVLSSYGADRYLEGERLPYQRAEVYETAARMRQFLALPHETLAAEGRSFAFMNPTIYIIDLEPVGGAP